MKLIDYQVTGANFLVSHKRVILADEMGLGKTIEAIDALRQLQAQSQNRFQEEPHATGPALAGGLQILIACPKSALYVWQSELTKWLPTVIPTMIIGTPVAREKLWKAQVVLVTLDMLRIDINKARRDWDVIIIDEAHKIKNRKTKGFKAIKRLRSTYLWLLTGTPSSRGAQDMWAYLHLINHKLFSSYWKFVNTFCVVVNGTYGMEILGTRNAKQLKELLTSYLIRRTKEGRAPPKTRQKILVDIDPQILGIYQKLAGDMIAEMDSGGALITPTVLAKLTALRQLLVCPKLLDSSLGYGTSIATVLDIIQDYDDHFVIISPFSSALPYFETYLNSKGYRDIVTLKGGMGPKEVKEAIDSFKAQRGIALMSLKFAQSFSLETAVHGYFIGFAWDPIMNFQAEDRINRMNSVGAATLSYLVHKDSVEEELINPTLNAKTQAVNAFLEMPKVMKALKNLMG